MPDTKIKKTDRGWIDVDRPNTAYRVRRLAREARRNELAKANPNNTLQAKKQTAKAPVKNVQAMVVGYQPGPGQNAQIALTQLQQKLFDRLTNRQGVNQADALQIIVNNGYNKAASYGHMREAGANHYEAKIVIDLNNPDVSLAYGLARGQGMNHADALSKALKQ